MSTRYLAEIIPPADTAVEAFETVVDEEEEDAEVGNWTTFQINRENLIFQNLAKDMEMAPLAVSGNVQRASFWVRSWESSVSCFSLICPRAWKRTRSTRWRWARCWTGGRSARSARTSRSTTRSCRSTRLPSRWQKRHRALPHCQGKFHQKFQNHQFQTHQFQRRRIMKKWWQMLQLMKIRIAKLNSKPNPSWQIWQLSTVKLTNEKNCIIFKTFHKVNQNLRIEVLYEHCASVISLKSTLNLIPPKFYWFSLSFTSDALLILECDTVIQMKR